MIASKTSKLKILRSSHMKKASVIDHIEPIVYSLYFTLLPTYIKLNPMTIIFPQKKTGKFVFNVRNNPRVVDKNTLMMEKAMSRKVKNL
jgi:hypothetical protein